LYRADHQAGQHRRQDVPQQLGTAPATFVDALHLLLERPGLELTASRFVAIVMYLLGI
jgi:hypothetical protein